MNNVGIYIQSFKSSKNNISTKGQYGKHAHNGRHEGMMNKMKESKHDYSCNRKTMELSINKKTGNNIDENI
ncbi:hypothetical protein [Sporosalibacterium faouarense]|uniref:hypothetical protein n=1 Tax=Sporosalibacterium faouarense TaxID=516123 RepID=UPI00192B818C|nr:hypothetical protein [Sporosalibacterium faouarense]